MVKQCHLVAIKDTTNSSVSINDEGQRKLNKYDNVKANKIIELSAILSYRIEGPFMVYLIYIH